MRAAECELVFTDTTSGAKTERPGLDQVMSHLRNGDILVVGRLDRLGRSLKHPTQTVTHLQARTLA